MGFANVDLERVLVLVVTQFTYLADYWSIGSSRSLWILALTVPLNKFNRNPEILHSSLMI